MPTPGKIGVVQGAAEQLVLFPDAEEPGSLPGFSVRESGRARRLSIKVYPRGRVEVVVPRRTRPEEVQAFVTEHRDWIADARAEFAKLHPHERFALPDIVELAAIGQRYRIRYERPGRAKGVRYRSRNNVVVLSGRTGDGKPCVAALKRWLSAVARAEFEPRLKALSALTGNPFSRMHVRGQKSCWGSHSSSGTISLNYCLLFLEPELVRYLMIHELCHAQHMNHSRRFWRLVATYEPAYRRLDKRLGDAWNAIPVWLGFN